MAYVPETDEEEKLAQQQQNNGQPMTIPGTSAGSAETPGGIPGTPTPAPQASQAGNQPFTDINAYLDANKEQGAGLAGQIGTSLAGEGKAAQDAADTAGSTFKGQVDASAYIPSASEIQGAVANPTEYIKDTGNAGKFTNAAGGTYNGPANLEALPEYQEASDKVTKATDRFGKINSEQGQRELLTGMETNPTAGQTSFDQLILGQNPNAVGTMKAAIDPYAHINDYLSGKATGAKTYVDTAKGNLGQAKTDIGNAIDPAIGGIKGDVASQLKAKQDALSGLIADENKALNTGQLTDQAAADMGITPEQLANLRQYQSILKNTYGNSQDLSEYYTQEAQPDSLTTQNAMTLEQEAQYKALVQLSGGQIDPNYTSNILSGNAGKFDTTAATEGLKGALQNEDERIINMAPGAAGVTDETQLRSNFANGNSPMTQSDIEKYVDAWKRNGGPGGSLIAINGKVINPYGFGALPGEVIGQPSQSDIMPPQAYNPNLKIGRPNTVDQIAAAKQKKQGRN
jgi:hypothetical protein